MPYSRLRSIADRGRLNVATRIFAEYSSVTSLDASRGSISRPLLEKRGRCALKEKWGVIIAADSQIKKCPIQPPQQPPPSPSPHPQPSPHAPSCSFDAMGRMTSSAGLGGGALS